MTFTSGVEPIFVDTNVFVYAFVESGDARCAVARDLVLELTSGDDLRVSTQVLQELFVTLTRQGSGRLTPTAALARLDQLCQWPVFAPDYAAIREACLLSHSAQISYWDALIVVSARRSGARVLLTEDLNHNQIIAGVRIVNPFR